MHEALVAGKYLKYSRKPFCDFFFPLPSPVLVISYLISHISSPFRRTVLVQRREQAEAAAEKKADEEAAAKEGGGAGAGAGKAKAKAKAKKTAAKKPADDDEDEIPGGGLD